MSGKSNWGVTWRAATLLSGLATGAAHADDTRYQNLDQRIGQIEQELRALKAQQTGSGATIAAQGPAANGFGGYTLASSDGQYTLNIHALVQMDGRFYPDAPGSQGSSVFDTFTLRRVEPSLQGMLTPLFSYVLMPEFGGSPTSTVTADVYGEFHFQPRYFNVRVGKFKEPFGLENLQSSANLAFVERGLPTDLAPNRDLGVQVAGSLGNARLTYAVGVFNGAPDGGDANTTDVDNHKDFALRLFAQPWHDGRGGLLDNLGLGLACTAGRDDSLSSLYTSGNAGSILGTNGILPQYRSPGQNIFFQYGSSANPVAADGVHDRLSPQASYYRGGFSALAEYVVTHQHLDIFATPGDARTVTTRAQELTVGYVLTGEQAGYGGVVPGNPYGSSGNSRGALEVVARAGQLTVGDEAFARFADGTALASIDAAARQARSQGIGLNWYLTRNLKVQADYDQTHFGGGAGNGNRPVEHALLVRSQYSF